MRTFEEWLFELEEKIPEELIPELVALRRKGSAENLHKMLRALHLRKRYDLLPKAEEVSWWFRDGQVELPKRPKPRKTSSPLVFLTTSYNCGYTTSLRGRKAVKSPLFRSSGNSISS